MTGRESLARAMRIAYGNAVREENPRMTLHIAAEPWETLPHERRRKWLAMAAAAEREFAQDKRDRFDHTVSTLQAMDCDPDEACLSTHDVLRMLGAHAEGRGEATG